MSFLKKYKIKKILLAVLWLVIGCASSVLLVAAVKKNDAKKCTGINIDISGVSNHYFIDKKDVEKIISKYAGGRMEGTPVDIFDLSKMENVLQNDIWIKHAEMFFDNNGLLQVDIEEREPVARIFTAGGSTFYIDSSLMMLPLSEKFSARLPVFTGFPSEARVLKSADSVLLKDIRTVATEIQADAFLMGMIDQVDITQSRSFEMIPKIGDQVIVFGDASAAGEKFKKLKLFYKNIVVRTGWDYYSVINLQYKGQVVGKIRGADDVSADSLRTVQMMALIAANAEKMAADSIKTFAQDQEKNNADSSMVQQSIQREETTEAEGLPVPEIKAATIPVIREAVKQPIEKPKVEVNHPAVIKKATTIVKPKTEAKKAITDSKKPKAVMEKKPVIKNEY